MELSVVVAVDQPLTPGDAGVCPQHHKLLAAVVVHVIDGEGVILRLLCAGIVQLGAVREQPVQINVPQRGAVCLVLLCHVGGRCAVGVCIGFFDVRHFVRSFVLCFVGVGVGFAASGESRQHGNAQEQAAQFSPHIVFSTSPKMLFVFRI